MRRPTPAPLTAPDQESVWAYPRPPRLEPVAARLRVVFDGVAVADTTAGYRVLETSHPPTYYLPPADIRSHALVPAPGGSLCEWKGRAVYFTVVGPTRRAERAAWAYPDPTPPFRAIAGHVAFYAGPMDACFVEDEQVTPQPGGFYGGWITNNIVGPFKGEPGSEGW
ncbi:MAG TPA: DUF427 domain-containing protein [Beijerinckiaceae bacterium]|jgi:uncharacterized protein (DUF427 family)